jgi:hypothetical protein
MANYQEWIVQSLRVIRLGCNTIWVRAHMVPKHVVPIKVKETKYGITL